MCGCGQKLGVTNTVFCCDIQNLKNLHAGWMVPGGEGPPLVASVARQDAVHAAEANTAWLEDCSARLLCVLALDRFGDYVSDKVYTLGYPHQ